MESEQKEKRYCPECGKQVASTEDRFQTPQICPNCKTRVFFLDYSREPLPLLQDESGKFKDRDPKIDAKIGLVIAGGVIFLLLAGIIALVSGQVTLFFVIGCVGFLGGVVAISIYLDSRSKNTALINASKELDSRVRFHEANQTRLVHAMHGFKKNFETLVEEERKRLWAEHNALMDETSAKHKVLMAETRAEHAEAMSKVQSARQSAARKLEIAEEQASAARDISKRLFTEVRKSIKSRLTPNNYATQKDRFLKTVEFCKKKGYPVDRETINEFEVELKNDYEESVR